ncbi:MAG: LamG-like jellyroll fold domain-containing protein [Planctomycetota bacterium]
MAEVGNDASWRNISDASARNTNSSGDSVQIFGRGRNLDTQAGTGYISMSTSQHLNSYFKQGSFLIHILPQIVYTAADYPGVFMLWVDSNNNIWFRYDYSTDSFQLAVEWGASTITVNGPAYTENYSLQRPMNLMASWDSDQDFMMISIDGQVQATAVHTGTPSASNPTQFEVTADDNRSYPLDSVVDNIKTFSECLLPYGAFFIGNGDGLINSISNPHKDLCFFYDCQNSGAGAAKGGVDLATDYTITLAGDAALTTADKILGTKSVDIATVGTGNRISFPIDANNFDGSFGRMGMWVNFQTVTASEYFLGFGDATDFINLYISASSYFYAIYNTSGGIRYMTSTLVPTAGVWYWVELAWDDSDYIDFWVNGQLLDSESSLGSWAKTTGTMYLGADESGWNSQDCLIGAFYMSKNRYTPQVWTAFGKPLHIDLVKKNGVYQQYGA